ncbi:hypothetical protein JKP75_18195 [Blastococcus sp. TML/M2B]|uniref:hypothetical protein n=1 Tax=Blastococcus sp. TML/M2B TaxID=2798727 RepID=UPI00190A7D28|nr:hypothetical protein [Blastococcus sp. TML/M2B]MBN1094311.1 hypothetical protein [Blastococcus sp. TML/M2B]
MLERAHHDAEDQTHDSALDEGRGPAVTVRPAGERGPEQAEERPVEQTEPPGRGVQEPIAHAAIVQVGGTGGDRAARIG